MVQHPQECPAGEFAVCASILSPEVMQLSLQRNSHPPYSTSDFLTLLVNIQEWLPAFTDTVNLPFLLLLNIIKQSVLSCFCKTKEIHIMWSFQCKRSGEVFSQIHSVKSFSQMRQKEWAQARKAQQTWKTKKQTLCNVIRCGSVLTLLIVFWFSLTVRHWLVLRVEHCFTERQSPDSTAQVDFQHYLSQEHHRTLVWMCVCVCMHAHVCVCNYWYGVYDRFLVRFSHSNQQRCAGDEKKKFHCCLYWKQNVTPSGRTWLWHFKAFTSSFLCMIYSLFISKTYVTTKILKTTLIDLYYYTSFYGMCWYDWLHHYYINLTITPLLQNALKEKY